MKTKFIIFSLFYLSFEREFTGRTTMIESFNYQKGLIVIVDSEGNGYSCFLSEVVLPSDPQLKQLFFINLYIKNVAKHIKAIVIDSMPPITVWI